jgi:hypothetical protein
MDSQIPTDGRSERDDPEVETEAERRRNNIYLALFAVVVVGIGVWLVNALVDARKADECISSGQRRCKVMDVTPR